MCFGLVFVGRGVNLLLQEFQLDGSYMRFVLCATLPLSFCVSWVSIAQCICGYKI